MTEVGVSFASACLLSYERPGFLKSAVHTMLATPGAPLELIIHDDGSRAPEVRPLISGLLDSCDCSAAIFNPPGHNQGVGLAMNRCFAIAEGDPLIKIDQDLVFEPYWLRTVNELLEANPQIGLLSGFRYWHDPCDWRKTLVAQHDGWQEHEYIMGSFMAVRRACWEELGPFDSYSPAFAEDHIFQRKVTESERWVCGTPNHDLMRNMGYGLGPSTVCIEDASVEGGIRVKSIHTAPRLLK